MRGTFEICSDYTEMRATPDSAQALITLLQDRHFGHGDTSLTDAVSAHVFGWVQQNAGRSPDRSRCNIDCNEVDSASAVALASPNAERFGIFGYGLDGAMGVLFLSTEVSALLVAHGWQRENWSVIRL